MRNGMMVVVAVASLAGGCAPPRAVEPLLAVGERAMIEEAEHIEADAARDEQWLVQSRDALEEAYERDLHERGELDTAWVMQATRGYIAAREALVRHESALARQREQRRANLLDAADAVARVQELLAQQRALWPEQWDVRRLWQRD